MPHAIVTGASSGIGEAIVSRLLGGGMSPGLAVLKSLAATRSLTAYVSISVTARRCVMC